MVRYSWQYPFAACDPDDGLIERREKSSLRRLHRPRHFLMQRQNEHPAALPRMRTFEDRDMLSIYDHTLTRCTYGR